ncbi:MAG: hypothetical protein ACI30K_03655 [Muribaculaceae bacterium]
MKAPRLAAAILLCLMTIAYAMMYYLTPFQLDDFIFAGYYRQCAGGSSDFSLSALADYVSIVRFEENGRLANLLAGPWVMWLPKALAAALMALCTTAMIHLMAKLAAPSARFAPVAIAAAWLTAGIALAWREYIWVADMFLNYIPASVCFLLFITTFSRHEARPGAAATVAAALIALLTAWWHEACAIGGIAAIAAVALTQRLRLSPRQWIMAAAFAIGTVIVLTSPAIWHRFAFHEALDTFTWRGYIKLLPCTTIVCITAVSISLTRRGRRYLRRSITGDTSFIMLAAAMVAGAALLAKINAMSGRAAWFAELPAAVLLLSMLRHVALPTLARRIAATAAALLMCLLMASAIRWQAIYHDFDDAVWAKIKASPHGTAFCDDPPRCPRATTLFYPTHMTWCEKGQYLALSGYYGHRIIAVVPQCLDSLSSLEQLTPIPGNAGLYTFGSAVVARNGDVPSPSEIDIYDHLELTYYATDGSTYWNVPSIAHRFITNAGDTLINVRPGYWRVKGPFVRIDTFSR